MRSAEILLLVGAAGIAFYLIQRSKTATTAAAPTGTQTMSSQSLAYYLKDIYARLDAGEQRDSAYLTDIYGRIGGA